MNKAYSLLLALAFFSLQLPCPRAFAQTPANLNLQLTNGVALLSITGAASNACTLQFATNLTALNPWHFLANFPATNDPAAFSDTNPIAAGMRFYRIFTQSLPTNVIPVTNMIWISPGTFTMGSPTNEALRGSDETQHTVTLTQGFYLGKYLVTQGDYLALVGTNPSYFTASNGYTDDPNRPVENVSWNVATNYCALLTQQETLAGRLPAGWAYRLPTESEWEYACRAGTTTAFYFGNTLLSGTANFDGTSEYDSTVGTITNTNGISLAQTTAVGSYEANGWGLSDMCGNVWEWCQDWYGNYPDGTVTDPQGPASGIFHVIRGGAWRYQGVACRSAQRYDAYGSVNYLGFRVVLAPN